MLDRINPWSIVRDHFKTFQHPRDKFRKRDIIGFLLLPVALAAVSYIIPIEITPSGQNVLLTSYSLLTGLLLNLLVLLYEVGRRRKTLETEAATIERDRLIRFCYRSISFSILLGIVTVGILFSLGFTGFGLDLRREVTAVVVGLSASFGLTLLLVLMRFYELVRVEVEQ